MLRLSLLVATYNRSASLLGALEAVAGQRADPAVWECVVVDNNSEDDTAACVEAFRQAHPGLNLRLVRESRQGLSHARNRGIAESRGEYLAIIDDDERINPDFVRAYIDFFDTHPEAAAAGGRIIAEYPQGRPRWMSRWTEAPIANPIDLGPKVRPFPPGRIPGGGNMALRRTAVERHGAFDPSLGRTGKRLLGGEESDLFERLRKGGEQIWYVPDAVMWHIIGPEKLTDDYFDRLSFNVGRSQRARAEIHGRMVRLLLGEALKWAATLVLAAGCLLGMRPAKAGRLLRMRARITRGILCPRT